MLHCVANSCVRHGRRLSVPVGKFFSDAVNSAGGLTVPTGRHSLSPHGSSRPSTAASWHLSAGPLLRSLSVTAASRGDTQPPGTAVSAPEDTETFGSVSKDMSSKRWFRKSRPDTQVLRYGEHRALDGEEEKDDGDDDDDDEELRAVRRPSRRNTPYWYSLQCKKLIKENKLQEALDLFSINMLKVERLTPEEYNYTVLIGGYARAGQMKKAFRLYNDMKKRGLKGSDATYTALFNACAETQNKHAGLQQALKLEQELQRKNYTLSTFTYHALLKAHAITNNLQACLHTLREMLQNGHVVTQKTFHYLLMGCLPDKEKGFKLALQVWRHMLKSGIRPDSTNYNLLLRTARDCGIGDPAVAASALLSPGWESHIETQHASESRFEGAIDIDQLERQLFLLPDGLESVNQQETNQLIPVRQIENIQVPVNVTNSAAPNLLDIFEGSNEAVVSLGNVDGPFDRLALIGGPVGFLKKMEDSGLSPDLKTLTMMTDMVDPGYKSLQTLLRVAKQHQIKVDVSFFNSAIRRAAKAGDAEAVQSVVRLMRQRHVGMNVQTFWSLALGCENQKDGLQLLKDMEEAGFKPDVGVFSTLISRASRRLDFRYLKTILNCMKDMKVWPNEVIIKQLEFAAQYPANYDKYKSRNNYLVQIDGFRGYYRHWLTVMPAQDAGDEKADLQTETPKPTLEDGLTQAERNKRAAAQRFKSQKSHKTRIVPV